MAWWEDSGQAGIGQGRNFNAVAFIFQMKNRFPKDYRDKQVLEHTGDAFREFLAMARKAGKPGPDNPHKGDDDAEGR